MPNSNERLVFTQANGVAAVVIPADMDLTWEEIAETAVPDGVTYDIVDVSEIPADRMFRGAWEVSAGKLAVSLARAKEVSHSYRRRARDIEMAPLDDIVAKNVPGSNPQQAENARVALRGKYEALQAQIDAASDVDALKALIAPYASMKPE